MKATPRNNTTGCRTASGSGNGLQIQVVTRAEHPRFDRLLGAYHYLGESRPTGDFLRQVAVLDGQWVGLLAWGSACYALQDRDLYTGGRRILTIYRRQLGGFVQTQTLQQ